MSDKSIPSRTLSEWLYTLSGLVDSFDRVGGMLGLRNDPPPFPARDIENVATWLYDAKFEVRDPYRLRVAVAALIRSYDKGGLTDAAHTQELMAALKKEFEPYQGMLLEK